jgi:hypothetical protein
MSRPGKPNLKPWAIGSALLVVGGIVVALLTGGGTGSDSNTSSAKLPAGGQSTIVKNAPPPKMGDKVLAAAETNVHGIRYRVVASIPTTENAKVASVPLYFNEYLDGKLLSRYQVPDAKFFADSVVVNFKLEANPDPNPGRTAGIAFSWFRHAGDPNHETKYYEVTPHGIRLY